MGDSSFSLSGLLDELEQELADDEPKTPPAPAPVALELDSNAIPLSSALDSSLTGLLERLNFEESQHKGSVDLRKSSCLPLSNLTAQAPGRDTCAVERRISLVPRPWALEDKTRIAAIISRAEDANPTFRNYMEDGAKIVDPFLVPSCPNGESWGFFAVYDGHGGREATDYCETRLHEQLLVEMKKMGPMCDINRALTAAFQSVDSQLAMYGAWNHGSTATVALVQRRQSSAMKVYIANVGDSRAVLFGRGSVRRLSKDHRPDDPAEAQRVVKDGGKVIGGRVGGDLAISRSLGDHRLKGKGLSCVPDVSTSCLQAGDVVIIASDGLWDVLEDGAACDIVERCIQQAVDLGVVRDELTTWLQDNTAQELVDEAKKLGSQDNLLVIALFF